jgi:hypothetical protein
MTSQSIRLSNLLRHIDHVRSDCLLLGTRLIEGGEEELGLKLIANGQIHDNSKFSGIEWLYLNDTEFPRVDPDPNREMFLAALQQHVTTNPHHPEFWGSKGISDMPRLYLAELVADWHSRSSEQGTSLLDWVKDRATQRFKFSTSSRVYKELKELVLTLLDRKMV